MGKLNHGELFEYIDGKWEKIQLPKNVITPRDIYYKDGVLYISGIAKAIWDGKNGTDFNNYSGGVYAYQNNEFTQIFDESISTTSVQIDSRGTIYISDLNGNIYRKEKGKDYQKIYDSYHYISKWLQISKDDDYLYLASSGGGLLKLENLNSLYEIDYLIGDIDNDGKVSINDLAKLKLHLIDIEKLTTKQELKAADVDEDGKISINDLACLKLMLLEFKI